MLKLINDNGKDLFLDPVNVRVPYRKQPEHTADPVIEFNRVILKSDLKRIHNNLKKGKVFLSDLLILELDKYFDIICELAGYEASIFKMFFRRLLNEKRDLHSNE